MSLFDLSNIDYDGTRSQSNAQAVVETPPSCLRESWETSQRTSPLLASTILKVAPNVTRHPEIEHRTEAIVVGNLSMDQHIGPQEVARPFVWANSCPAEEVATSGSQGTPRRSAGAYPNPLGMKRGLPLRQNRERSPNAHLWSGGRPEVNAGKNLMVATEARRDPKTELDS